MISHVLEELDEQAILSLSANTANEVCVYFFRGRPLMTSPTNRGSGDLPKGDVTPQPYLVQWVTRGREGSKISKNG